MSDNRYADRVVRAPRGTEITAKNWLTEAAKRMLMNNLDPEVAEHPKSLVVYGGIGRAQHATGSALTKSLKPWIALKPTSLYWCNQASQ